MYGANDKYNPHWRILISDDDQIGNTLVDAPSEDDNERYQKYMGLRRDMREYLKKEERAMQQRIEDFTAEQNRQFEELQAKMFLDRKIVWHRMSKSDELTSSSDATPAGGDSVEDAEEKEAEEGEAEEGEAETQETEEGDSTSELTVPSSEERSEPTTPTRSSKKNDSLVVPASPLPEDFAPPPSDPAPPPPSAFARRSSATPMFSFDDIDTPEQEDSPVLDDEDEEAGENYETLDDGIDDFRPKRGDSPGQYLACSMPVTIPPRFSAFASDPRALKRQNDAPEEEQDVYGKSFQVPTKKARGML